MPLKMQLPTGKCDVDADGLLHDAKHNSVLREHVCGS